MIDIKPIKRRNPVGYMKLYDLWVDYTIHPPTKAMSDNGGLGKTQNETKQRGGKSRNGD